MHKEPRHVGLEFLQSELQAPESGVSERKGSRNLQTDFLNEFLC